MTRLLKPGRIIFALGLIGLGVLCFMMKDFIIGRPPGWPAGSGINPVLGYVTGGLSVLAGGMILFNIRPGQAAILMALLILFLSAFRHLFLYAGDWPNTYKSFALSGGAMIIAWSYFKNFNGAANGLNRVLLATGIILLSAFLVICGYLHFKFAAFVIDFIPAYIPFHSFWTYFCGVCLIAGGVGLLIPALTKWAALLSGIMIAGWFILLHIPRFIANSSDAGDRFGLAESFTFAGIFFTLAAAAGTRKNSTNH